MIAAVARGRRDVGIEERPLPEPDPGEVRLRIEACGVCGTDLHLYELGAYTAGISPGHEMAGQVDALGDGVSGLAAGDRVVVEPLHACGRCAPCQRGLPAICIEGRFYGVHRDGGFAEHIVVPAERVFAAPVDLDPAVAALAEPAAVAVHGLRRVALEPGQRVLVLGAGAVGQMALLAARFLGASHVEVSARHAAQAEAARRLGADRVRTEAEASPDALAGLPAGERPDVVVETVGGQADTLRAAAHAAAPGGAICVLGLFMGDVSLPGLPLFTRELTVAWSNCYARDAARADFADAVALVDAERERLADYPSHRVPLAQIDEAYALAANKRAGAIKVSVVP